MTERLKDHKQYIQGSGEGNFADEGTGTGDGGGTNSGGNGRGAPSDCAGEPFWGWLGRTGFFACPDPSDLAAALINSLVRPT